MNISEKQMYVVFYSTDRMRERHFENEHEANEFSLTVKGSVCPYKAKTYQFNSNKEQRSFNKELKRIKQFGY